MCTRRASVHALFSAAALALLGSSTAFATPAGEPPVPPLSAIAQYVEVVPTSSGGAAIGVGAATVKPLPAARATALRRSAGEAAASLETVATSSSYGAPVTELPMASGRSGAAARVQHPERAGASSVPALGSIAIGGGGSGRLVVLAALLAAATGVMLAVAARRRRADRS